MSEPDRVDATTEVTDHVAGGLALLTSQFRGQPAARAVLASWIAQVQDLETALFDLLSDGLTSAVGAQLDQIGDLLGRPRSGLSDDEYRLLLTGIALAIKSSGTGPELVEIADILCKVVPVTLSEPGVAVVKVEPAAHISLSASLVLEALVRAKVAGVRILVVDVPSGSTFAFSADDRTATDSARGFSDTSGLVGGQLVGVLEG